MIRKAAGKGKRECTTRIYSYFHSLNIPTMRINEWFFSEQDFERRRYFRVGAGNRPSLMLITK